jgi:hypothetical protein
MKFFNDVYYCPNKDCPNEKKTERRRKVPRLSD